MARKKKLNTDLDDSIKTRKRGEDEELDSELEGLAISDIPEEGAVEDDVMYTMGEIVFAEEGTDEDKQILTAGVRSVSKEGDDEDDDTVGDEEVWIDEDTLSADDPFLDAEDEFDPENDDRIYD